MMKSAYTPLSEQLVERVLAKLDLAARPALHLNGLNELYAAWCGAVPFDNVRKRIWFAGDRKTPLPGGDPTDFFEHWLTHGTGGTCWPGNGALFALVHALGFNARRIAGAMIDGPNRPERAGHGSVVVSISGTDYLVDASILSFEPLPLIPGESASTSSGIHRIRAAWTDSGVDVTWLTGHARDTPICFRPDPEYHSVDHAFFLDGYERSKHGGPFNHALRASRRFPDSIVTIHRDELTTVTADGAITKERLTDAQRAEVLVDRLEFSEPIVRMIPEDEPPAE